MVVPGDSLPFDCVCKSLPRGAIVRARIVRKRDAERD